MPHRKVANMSLTRLCILCFVFLNFSMPRQTTKDNNQSNDQLGQALAKALAENDELRTSVLGALDLTPAPVSTPSRKRKSTHDDQFLYSLPAKRATQPTITPNGKQRASSLPSTSQQAGHNNVLHLSSPWFVWWRRHRWRICDNTFI